MLHRRVLLRTVAISGAISGATLAAPRPVRAQGSTPIRIGEINSYSAQPAFTLPYRNGMELAIDEINASNLSAGRGGALGRKLEIQVREFRTRLEIKADCDLHPVNLGPSAELTVYRLVQEALTNISTYARASEVSVHSFPNLLPSYRLRVRPAPSSRRTPSSTGGR